MPAGYRSQIQQALHYFARPHTQPRREPLEGPSAWRGDALQPAQWVAQLTEEDVDEIERAIERARRLGKPIGELTSADFPLPRLDGRFAAWRRELTDGRRFVVVRGVPVERWSLEDSELFFWCFGLLLGIPGAQNPHGDLLGHVRDQGVAPGATVRAYRTNEHIEYHCDAADVVGLLCLKKAKRGGQSMIASSVSVYNELLERRPDLIDQLYEPFQLDTRGEGSIDVLPIAPCRYADGQLRTFYHSDYFRSAPDRASARPLTTREHELLDAYDEVLASDGFALCMDLQPGDIQLLSNHAVVHGRTGYQDHDDPELRRHLLRLWLSLPTARSIGSRLRTQVARATVLGELGRSWIRSRLAARD